MVAADLQTWEAEARRYAKAEKMALDLSERVHKDDEGSRKS
jgi:hypothetical protein